jgi:hypothetical protein
MLLQTLFIILHVATAAAWFGMALRLPAHARLALAAGPAAAAIVADDTGRTVRLMGFFLILTLAFSLLAFFLGGGFATYGAEFHTAILLFVLLIVAHYALLRPAWSAVHRAAMGGDGKAPLGRIAMATGLSHTLWLIILVLMFWRRLVIFL